jgi:hypothetical protein
MSVFLAVSGMAVLLVVLVLFVRARREAPQGTPLPNGRALVILTFLGLMLGLASQLPLFR